MQDTDSYTNEHVPFRLTRFLSWVSLVLILVSSISLAIFIGNSAKNTLLQRQQQYALLISNNLNQQIFRRFTLPTYLAFGRIALRQTVQYQRLDEVVQSTIPGLHLESLRIYGGDRAVNYSLDQTELGRTDITPASIDQVLESSFPFFETLSNTTLLHSMFKFDLEPGSFSLRTLFPLTVDLAGDDAEVHDPLITGVLEITQDITEDYITIVHFQWLMLAVCLGSSIILFGLLQFFIVRSEKIIMEHMEETRKLEAELHQSEKLASMGRVVATIAHEVRNPLGIIRSTSELLMQRMFPAAESQQLSKRDAASKNFLSVIYDESCRLSQIVNEFLDYARPRTPQKNLIDLNAILSQALAFLESELTKFGIEFVRQTPDQFFACGDKDLVYRAFYNIIVNAYQAIGRDGIIRIRGRLLENGNAEIVFHDSGPGFSPEAIKTALDPFFTTKHNGTGLGLAIVNSIIISHEGTLTIQNSPSGGAVVTIQLPGQDSDAPDSLTL